MKTNHFNICPSCIYRDTCVLTAQKDKVWSCSEFDAVASNENYIKIIDQPELNLHLV